MFGIYNMQEKSRIHALHRTPTGTLIKMLFEEMSCGSTHEHISQEGDIVDVLNERFQRHDEKYIRDFDNVAELYAMDKQT